MATDQQASSAEYILAGGNPNASVRRGNRTETMALHADLNAVPVSRSSHLPVVVDPIMDRPPGTG
jgi:3-deoxy-D-arabino-heptulosonate 7-phosphate (DAHP) synthase